MMFLQMSNWILFLSWSGERFKTSGAWSTNITEYSAREIHSHYTRFAYLSVEHHTQVTWTVSGQERLLSGVFTAVCSIFFSMVLFPWTVFAPWVFSVLSGSSAHKFLRFVLIRSVLPDNSNLHFHIISQCSGSSAGVDQVFFPVVCEKISFYHNLH